MRTEHFDSPEEWLKAAEQAAAGFGVEPEHVQLITIWEDRPPILILSRATSTTRR